MSPLLCVALYVTIGICRASYFLSSNPLNGSTAETLCVEYCSSHLVSIHNGTQFSQIINMIQNSFDISSPPLFDLSPYFGQSIFVYDVWIGLHRTGTTLLDLSWHDGSLFDYGTTRGFYPWNSGEPNFIDEPCVHLYSAQGYRWNDVRCNSYPMRFMCNSCVAKLNKYILIKQLENYSNAQTFCKNNLGTDLASIHSEDDYIEAKLLCQYNQKNCWIGLNAVNNTNNNGEHCMIMLRNQSYAFNDINCAKPSYFICNMKSEVCSKTQWNYEGDLYWTVDNICEVNSETNSNSIINSKQWSYDDNIWLIDYLFTVHNVYNYNYGKCGILIYHFDTICDYYYVGITINNINNVAYIFIDKYVNGLTQEIYLSSALFEYEYDIYYTLQVKLIYVITFLRFCCLMFLAYKL